MFHLITQPAGQDLAGHPRKDNRLNSTLAAFELNSKKVSMNRLSASERQPPSDRGLQAQWVQLDTCSKSSIKGGQPLLASDTSQYVAITARLRSYRM